MTKESINHSDIDHTNRIYEDAVENFYRLAAMEYKSECERAMALKPYLDLINSFDTAKREGAKQVGMEIAQKMLAMRLDMKTVVEITVLTEEMIFQ